MPWIELDLGRSIGAFTRPRLADLATEEARFLRLGDGACDLFSTVLWTDYHAAYRDQFQLHQARRGTLGWRGCR